MKSNSEIIEQLKELLTAERLDRIEAVLKHRTSSLTLVLDDITHLHNTSAVIRTAEAFGLTDIYLLTDKSKISSSEFSEGISLGAEKWINLHLYNSVDRLLEHLRANEFSMVALVPPEKYPACAPVSLLPFEKPLALMLGNEVRGLRKELIDAADIMSYIPMYGFVESLNISVACAITLFCSTIEHAKPARRTKLLDEDIKGIIRNEWIRKSVQNVELIEKNLLSRQQND